MSAIDVIIDHIINYQNNYISCFLFQKNFSNLIDKGVKMSRVLRSEIFSFHFDYDEWPSNHVDDNTYYRPYNESIFELRGMYRKVFYEEEFEDISGREVQSDKVYKIKYSLNMLPYMGECVRICPRTGDKIIDNQGYSILNQMCEADELELFDTEQIIDIIPLNGRNLPKKCTW